MKELIQVLIGAVVGFVFGLVAEPAKAALLKKVKLAEWRHALYRNFVRNLVTSSYLVKILDPHYVPEPNVNLTELRALQLNLIDTSLFDALTQGDNLLLFQQLADAAPLRFLYGRLKAARHEVDIGSALDVVKESLDSFVGWVATYREQKLLDEKLLRRQLEQHMKEKSFL